MAKCRPGKAERALLKAQWAQVRSARKELIQSNLSAPRPEPVRYATTNLQSRMTHGLYRGLYDPLYSSDRDTGRGLSARKVQLKRPWYVTQDKVK